MSQINQSNQSGQADKKIGEYRCPNCGGSIEFNAAAQKMKCPYCDSEYSVQEVIDYSKQRENKEKENAKFDVNYENVSEEFNEFKCSYCGGDIIAAASTTAATECPYCGNPVVMVGRVSGILKPDAIIPFHIDKDGAKNAYKSYISGKRLLPKSFADENHIDEIKGVYEPVWLFSSGVFGSLKWEGTRVRTWSDRNYIYTETSFFEIERTGNIAFSDVPVDGSKVLDNKLFNSVEPFDSGGKQDFTTGYLAGYYADKYDEQADECASDAYDRMKQSVIDNFSSTVTGFASLRLTHNDIELKDKQAKYAMYPMWLLSSTYKDKKYSFAMNGQTGKFTGNLPVDTGALVRWLLLLTAIIGAIAFVIINFLLQI